MDFTDKTYSRYLLCQPRGGLNDTLVQIEKCWRYAEQFERTLVVDTRHSGIHDHLSNYFSVIKSRVEVITHCDDVLLKKFEEGTIRPASLAGRLRTMEVEYLKINWVDVLSKEWITFDLTRDHPERCLVHHQCGGGELSIEALGRLGLIPPVAGMVRKRLEPCALEYDALHVRHSDYKSDYRSFFRKIHRRVSGRRLLVCSDSAQVIEEARRFFVGSDVFTITVTPDNRGVALHRKKETEEVRHELNLSLLIDLLGLSGARNLYFPEVKNPNFFKLWSWKNPLRKRPPRTHRSGYSNLASLLKARPEIRRQLLQAA